MDERPFAGTAALVTGGAVRLGATLSSRLAAVGCEVAIHRHTSGAEAADLARRLASRGDRAVVVQADLASPDAAAGLVDAASQALGKPIDFLVNNASAYPGGRLPELAWEPFAATLRATAWAPFELTRGLVAQVTTRRRGAVVNVLDARIADYDWDHAGYHLAKRMLADLTTMCAVQYAPRVTVNAVAPGPVLGPPGDPGFAQRMRRHLPLRRTPSPDDVADAVLYLLGAPSVTGQTVFVDGGRHLGRAVYG